MTHILTRCAKYDNNKEFIMLPKIELPKYELTIPSNSKKIKYTPFTLKHEKLLLIAKEAGDVKSIILAIEQIIDLCVDGVKFDDLSFFDLEYIFMNIRSKSVSNEITFKIKDDKTDEYIEIIFNIDDVKVHTEETHTKIFKLSDTNYTIEMKYPTINMYTEYYENGDNPEIRLNMLKKCIYALYDKDDRYIFSEFSENDINEFFDSLTSDHINQIEDFFKTMPRIRYEHSFKRSDQSEGKFVIEGLKSFFI